jgi:hypothetical protein
VGRDLVGLDVHVAGGKAERDDLGRMDPDQRPLIASL